MFCQALFLKNTLLSINTYAILILKGNTQHGLVYGFQIDNEVPTAKPKEEIRQEILLAAENEFYKRGYRDASMRTIARKANTTLGNIYNYFENKEALLDAVIGDIPEKINAMIEKHREFSVGALTKDNYLAIIGDILPEVFPLDLLMSKGIVILLEGCEGTKYTVRRNCLLKGFFPSISPSILGFPMIVISALQCLREPLPLSFQLPKAIKAWKNASRIFTIISLLLPLVFQTLQIPDRFLFNRFQSADHINPLQLSG